MKKAKRLLSVILALAMAAALSAPAFAAESAKSIKFLNDFIDTRSIEVDVDDSAFSGFGISVTDVEVKAKFEGENKTKIAAKADVGPLSDVKIIGGGNELNGYFSFLKINIKEILGANFNIDDIANQFYPILDKLDKETVSLLSVKETKDVSLKDYGTVKAEILTVSPDAIAAKITAEAVKQGKQAEIEGKDIEALVALAKELNIEELDYYIALYAVSQSENGIASFYYRGDDLIGAKVNLVDKETLKEQSIDTTEAIGIKVESISAGVSDSDFNAPGFAFDITGLVKFILNLFFKN